MDRFVRFVHARGRDAGTLDFATALRHRILRRHDRYSPSHLPNALFMARLAQETGSYGMVPGRARRTLGRYDARSVPALSLVAEMELERDAIPPGARLGALRRLGGGRDMGSGEDGMGKALARWSPVSPRSRGREEWRSATAGGRGTVSVRAQPSLRRGLPPDLGRSAAHAKLGPGVSPCPRPWP